MAQASADPSKATDVISAADERTPLLGLPDTAGTKALGGGVPSQGISEDDSTTKPSSEEDEASEAREPRDEDEDKPMPHLQILILCHASLVEPVAYFAIFPIISEMLEKTGGLDVKNIGFWAGLIESLFSVVQMLLMIAYGRLADRIGRKPVLVFSLIGITISTALFGLSRNLWQMVLLRCLTGVFAGSSVTIRAMLSENSTKQTQARAFSWYMFTRNVGISLGPLIGGGLANPAKRFPLFYGVSFFEQYPYALSLFVTACVCLTTVLTCAFVLKETLKTKIEGKAATEPPMSTWELLKSPGVGAVMCIFGHVILLALAYTAINPVMSYTPVELGGFGFPPEWTSIQTAVAGASQAAWMLGPFPPLQRRFGTGGVLRACAYAWPLLMAGIPAMNELLRFKLDTLFWVSLAFATVVGSGVSMAFACIQLCLNDIAPSPSTLGELNAIALTLNSGIRAIAPIVSTSIFAWGINVGWIDGHLVWVFIVALALILAVTVQYLPEKAEGRLQRKPADVEEH